MKFFFLYLDAGSGSYLIQVVIGAVLAGTVYFKTIWAKVKSVFGKRKPVDDDDIDEIAENTTEKTTPLQ